MSNTQRLVLLVSCCFLTIQIEGFAMREIDIPVQPPKDAIMASQPEIKEVQRWASLVFAGSEEKTEGPASLLIHALGAPFSFNYDGKPSVEFLKDWKHMANTKQEKDFLAIESSWEDPATGLRVTATAKVFNAYPAVDWLLHLENTGKQDTPIIENIQAADFLLDTVKTPGDITLRQLQGDSCSEASFTPFNTPIPVGQIVNMAPSRGRPSQETGFPFWNLQCGGQGVITAIGWSGQWAASYDRQQQGPLRFRAGMEKTHLVLHPGENIRTPRVLIMTWNGDRMAAHNRFRRLMLFQYVPRIDGRPLRLPVVLQTFDRYISRAEWPTEAGQLRAVETAHNMGCDTYWFDAGWFVGEFPNGVGNWFHKPEAFPNGLKPVADLCHKYGMQFIVWFEPCRVAPGTQIAREHPGFVLGGEKGGLYNLGDPQARRWITDLISKRLSEFGIDVYREDYNIDPLSFWRGNDVPDRQGMTEIRFVEGHYAFWDELRVKHPRLWIDNCASGGRRIDLETCMRSVPLWRSDTCCAAGHPEWNQMQSAALGQYIPLYTASAWDTERYVTRSSGTGGLVCELDYLNPGFSQEKAHALLAEIKDNQKYWYGDFYPLTPVTTAKDLFAAYQLHRADLDEGMVLAFRRPDAYCRGMLLELRGLAAKVDYRFEFIDEAGSSTSRVISGKMIQDEGLDLRIPGKGQSLLVRYKGVGKADVAAGGIAGKDADFVH